MLHGKCLYIKYVGKKGRGVFAGKPFKPGSVIEESPYVEIPARNERKLKNTVIESYWFDLKRGKSALGLGYVSLYNHSSDSNAEFSINARKKTIRIRALKNIRKNQEITIDYGYDPKE